MRDKEGQFVPHTRITKCGRVCIECLKWKPWKSIQTIGKRGYGSRCKKCFNKKRQSRAKNLPRVTSEQLAYVRYKSGGKKKTYSSEYMYLYRYGITKDEAIDLLRKQQFKCSICQRELSTRNERSWHVDHNHETGTVRGILCNRCNTGLGKFGDNITILQKAINYLCQTN